LQELDSLVAEVMRLLLFRRHRDGAPVPRAELNGVPNRAYKEKRALAPAVLALAQHRFITLLGMEMKELDKAKPPAAPGAEAKAAAGKVFVLRSVLPARLRAVVEPASEDAARGFSTVVLSLVSLAGDGGLAEEALWSQLGSLGVSNEKGGATHPSLGEPAALLNALVKQRYLQRSKAEGGEKGSFVLTLGENAVDEPGGERLGGFVKGLMKGRGARAAAAAPAAAAAAEEDEE
jgi:hypothetical protein